MKILIVCTYRGYTPQTNYIAPFIYDQIQSLELLNCEIGFVLVKGGRFTGYARAYFDLKNTIKKWNPNLVHAHGGLCGFIANLQSQVPVVTTYHGSDINNSITRIISKVSIRFSAYNIFVSKKLVELVRLKTNFSVIPCGVDFKDFYPITNKLDCREKLNLDPHKKYVLFSKMFYDPVKNYLLAQTAIEILKDVILLEFIGFTRSEACLLFNACDAVLMTSFSEGSPQFIKEAMACNCPIVSVDVGDVKAVIRPRSAPAERFARRHK